MPSIASSDKPGQDSRVRVAVSLASFLAVWVALTTVGVIVTGVATGGILPTDVLLLVACIGAIVSLRNRYPALRELGLHRGSAPRFLVLGSIAGALAVAIYVAVLGLAGWYRIEGAGGSLAPFLAMVTVLFMSAVWQEIVFRGVVFRLLVQMGNLWIGVVTSSIIFGVAHLANAEATLVGVLTGPALTGVWLALAYALSRSLWLVIGLHFGINLAALGLFDVVDIKGLGASLLDASIVGPELWVNAVWGEFYGLVQVSLEIGLILALSVVYVRRRARH